MASQEKTQPTPLTPKSSHGLEVFVGDFGIELVFIPAQATPRVEMWDQEYLS